MFGPKNLLLLILALLYCCATAGLFAATALESKQVGKNVSTVEILGRSKNSQALLAIGGIVLTYDRLEIIPSVERYDPAANSWTRVSHLPDPLVAGGSLSTILQGMVYSCGGEQSLSCYSYNPATNEWTAEDFGALPQNFLPDTLIGVGNKILALGATDSSNTILVYSYDSVKKIWSQQNSPPAVFYGYAVSSVGEKLYFAVGRRLDDQKVLSSAYSFDSTANRWEELENMATPRDALALVGFEWEGKNYLAALGGRDSNDKDLGVMEIFDIESGIWKISAPAAQLSAPREVFAATAARAGGEGYIYIAAGAREGAPLNSAEKLRIADLFASQDSMKKSLWEKIQPLNDAREIFSLFTV